MSAATRMGAAAETEACVQRQRGCRRRRRCRSRPAPCLPWRRGVSSGATRRQRTLSTCHDGACDQLWGGAQRNRGSRAVGRVARGAQVKVTRRARPPRHVAAQRPSTGPVAHETTAPRSGNGALQQVTLGTAAALSTRRRRRRLRAAAFGRLRRWPRCRLSHHNLGRALPLRWRRRQLLLREQRLELRETAVHIHEIVAEPHERRLVFRGAGHGLGGAKARTGKLEAYTIVYVGIRPGQETRARGRLGLVRAMWNPRGSSCLVRHPAITPCGGCPDTTCRGASVDRRCCTEG